MVDLDLVGHKLSEVRGRVARVRARRMPDAASLARDVDALELVSFNLMLAVQGCIDLATHICVDEGWGVPENARHAFEHLASHGVIDEDVLIGIRAAVGLRNVVAHAYGRVDPAIVHRATTDAGLAVLTRFVEAVAHWALTPR